MDQILAETDVALMFRSTIMLNCFASDIPIIMPGWIDFGWNRALMDINGVYLANDFSDLEARLMEWLDQPPQLSKDVAEYFVRSPEDGRDAFCSLVSNLMLGSRNYSLKSL